MDQTHFSAAWKHGSNKDMRSHYLTLTWKEHGRSPPNPEMAGRRALLEEMYINETEEANATNKFETHALLRFCTSH